MVMLHRFPPSSELAVLSLVPQLGPTLSIAELLASNLPTLCENLV